MAEQQTIKIDEIEYNIDDFSEDARAQLVNVRACDQRIQQLKLDLAIAQTARAAYGQALKAALPATEVAPAEEVDTQA